MEGLGKLSIIRDVPRETAPFRPGLEEVMQRPLKITSRDFALSEPVEAEIREKASALENYYERLSGCEVTVRAPAIKHHRKGGPFVVGIRMTVPGKELAVDRQAQEELSQAIREAFDAARRQLEDYVRELRGSVKTHEATALGHVIRLELALDYGFLETPDNREIYFHRNSLLGADFDKLEIGAEVRFVEEEGERGPQASTVIATKAATHRSSE
jgi:cold shock CspA family protein/ribosome-associated translation inhibitor RaiA